MPPHPTEWKKEFDEKFCSKDPEYEGCLNDVGSIIHSDDIKDFISSQIAAAERRVKEEIKNAILILPTLYGMPTANISREDVLIVIDDPSKAKDL